MTSKRFWLHTFNVRSSEWPVVQQLFFLQFFQATGLAFFFTSALASFLYEFSITTLPYVMICSSFLLWLAGFLYARLEHQLAIMKVAKIVTVVMAISMLLFAGGSVFTSANWYYFLMLAFFNVLYLLNNLEFWGIASLQFDVRQSKRLFGVISAGDIPAKFIGYSLAFTLIDLEIISPHNLLYCGSVAMLLSLPFLYKLEKISQLPGVKHPHPPRRGPMRSRVINLVKNYSFNALIRRLAILSFLITACIVINNFAFLSEVKLRQQSDIALASFISLFYAFVRVLALLFKLIFSSRLINRLGVKASLLITPLLLLGFMMLVVLSDRIFADQEIVFYVFGVTAIAIDILRSSVNSPVFLALMQPLATHERLRAHNILKGIMDPFAELFSGVVLLLVIYWNNGVNLVPVAWILLILSLLWILGIYLTNRVYLKTIIKSISSRFLGQDEFSLNDEQLFEMVKKKIASGNELEIIHILRMLRSQKTEQANELIVSLLDHPSATIQSEALRLLDTRISPELRPKLLRLLQERESPEIKASIIRLLCTTGEDETHLLNYLEDPNKIIQEAAITGLIQSGNDTLKNAAASKLTQLANSADAAQRKTAALIMGRINDHELQQQLSQMVNDPDPAVRDNALAAIGHSRNDQLIRPLLKDERIPPRKLIEVLTAAGSAALPSIQELITGPGCSFDIREKMIGVIGNAGSDRAVHLLTQFLHQYPEHTGAITKALYKNGFSPSDETRKDMEALAVRYLVYAAELLHMQKMLEPAKVNYTLLLASLQLELLELRETLLYIFGCLYEKENISRARSGFGMKNREAVANAMEIIDMTVRKDLAIHFNTVYEPSDIEQKCKALRKLFPENIYRKAEQIISNILREKPISFCNWTKACTLYVASKNKNLVEETVLDNYRKSPSRLLRETALYTS